MTFAYAVDEMKKMIHHVSNGKIVHTCKNMANNTANKIIYSAGRIFLAISNKTDVVKIYHVRTRKCIVTMNVHMPYYISILYDKYILIIHTSGDMEIISIISRKIEYKTKLQHHVRSVMLNGSKLLGISFFGEEHTILENLNSLGFVSRQLH